MNVLRDILYKVKIEAVAGDTSVAVNDLCFDSRKVSLNDVFIAVRGEEVDGHAFIDASLRQGAVAVVCEKMPDSIVNGVTYVQVEDTHTALAVMASNYYKNPSENIKVIGVTGTNGKTTIASLLYQLFRKAGYKTGLLSTVRIMVDDEEHKATHTTPDPLAINYYLDLMTKAGVEFCFMEVSSHGIAQKRTEGLRFSGGIFTNLTHDHLDYHNSFAAYRDVKKHFFDTLPKGAFALTNADDKNGMVMIQNTAATKYTYALKSYANFRAKILENQFSGLLLKIGENEVWVKLIGQFNAYNILAVYAAAELLGLETVEVLRLVSELESVQGRFQYFVSEGGITVIVDYAHTPDSLQNVLDTVNSIRTGNEEVITVVGCGGDRDRAKRPLMGEIAASLSTKVVFTSDNPRTEDPELIIEEMEKGVPPQYYNKTLSVTDRRQAIKAACQMADRNDIILIAGKGHETYQDINGERRDFDDFKISGELIKALDK
ncbi:UDP-N-acetylmuramoyl-L-alanyl-D-glutamate--2,6-diaminopimelate ligase [Sinomicrobium sp.]